MPRHREPGSKIHRELGRRIRDARLAAGLTQEEAAQRIGSDYKYVQDVERGVVNLRLSTLQRIARALRLTFWELMTPPKPKRKAPRR